MEKFIFHHFFSHLIFIPNEASENAFEKSVRKIIKEEVEEEVCWTIVREIWRQSCCRRRRRHRRTRSRQKRKSNINRK